MIHWLRQHAPWLTLASIVLSVGGILIGTVLVARMPADYFIRHPSSIRGLDGRIDWLRLGGRIALTAAGLLLAIGGLVMSLPLVPGPGILLLLVGVSLMTFPGKRRFELWILRRGPVLRTINRLRARAGRCPLLLPDGTPET